jgi:hypothetical protein
MPTMTYPTTASEQTYIEVTGGVDTHKDTHTAAALDASGRLFPHEVADQLGPAVLVLTEQRGVDAAVAVGGVGGVPRRAPTEIQRLVRPTSRQLRASSLARGRALVARSNAHSGPAARSCSAARRCGAAQDCVCGLV